MKMKSVTIVIALYNPQIDWLQIQLDSINNQTYPNIEIIAIDDCSPQIDFVEMHNIFTNCIKKFPFKLIRNEKNLGSNETFERLTKLATGEYVAYCDQDDYWHEEKIATLVSEICQYNAVLCSSDFSIMDDFQNIVATSATQYYKRYKIYNKSDVSQYLLTKNYIPGCTAIIRSDVAKAALPFVENMLHDHWLALFASISGNFRYVRQPLTSYRIHSNNQTGLLKGINTKEDYIRIRVDDEYKKFQELVIRLREFPLINRNTQNLFNWVDARLRYYRGDFFAIFQIIRHMHYNLYISIFDILVLKLPNSVFKFIVKLIRERKI